MKQFYRDLSRKKLFGVCSGISNYFDIDVSFVRLGFLVLFLCTGLMPSILIYSAITLLTDEK